MAGITICRVVVHRQSPSRRVIDQVATSERQERTHQAAASPPCNAGESRRRAAAQCAQEDGFDLIVLVMRGHDVLRAAALLQRTQPRVARTPRLDLGGVRSQMQRGRLARQPMVCREFADRLPDSLRARVNPMVHMRNHKIQLQVFASTV